MDNKKLNLLLIGVGALVLLQLLSLILGGFRGLGAPDIEGYIPFIQEYGIKTAKSIFTTASSTFGSTVTVSGALTAPGNVTLGDAVGDTLTISSTLGRGGTNNIPLYARDTFDSATTTLCSIENTDATSRWILDIDSDVTAASTTDLSRLMVATSSRSTGAFTAGRSTTVNAAWPATTASTSHLSTGETASTTWIASTAAWRHIWGSGEFLNWYSSSSVDFGGSGSCGVLYR